MLTAGLAGIIAYALAQYGQGAASSPDASAILRASMIMERALSLVARHHTVPEAETDPAIDPNRTGLIGLEMDDLTTSLGQLEAKRTTTNPNFAGLIVHLLFEAGVVPGDTVAIASSGSFPALLIASLAAAQAVEVRPSVIISLGASSFGATNTEFNLLHLYQLLLNQGVFSHPAIAVSLGGERDVGLNFEPPLQERLTDQISRSKLPFLLEGDLRANVRSRLSLYDAAAKGSKIAAFINIGGAYANLGTSPSVLELRPGLNRKVSLPPEDQRGVIFEMAARDVPIIHLLFIKGLASKYGLPWDPVPLPKAGDWKLPGAQAQVTARFWAIAALYFGILLVLALTGRSHPPAKNF